MLISRPKIHSLDRVLSRGQTLEIPYQKKTAQKIVKRKAPSGADLGGGGADVPFLKDSTPCRSKEIHFWPTDPKIFLKAPSAPIYTGGARANIYWGSARQYILGERAPIYTGGARANIYWKSARQYILGERAPIYTGGARANIYWGSARQYILGERAPIYTGGARANIYWGSARQYILGERAPKKTRFFFGQNFPKSVQKRLFWPVFSKNFLRRRKFGLSTVSKML